MMKNSDTSNLGGASQSLAEAVERWIRAEYYFRLGPSAYGTKEADWFTAATEQLRAALTGKNGLRGAARILGVKVEKDEEKIKDNFKDRDKPKAFSKSLFDHLDDKPSRVRPKRPL